MWRTNDARNSALRALAGDNVGSSEVEEIRRDEVVGEIAATYFRADGATSGVDINDRTSGPDLERLNGARCRVCATSGEHKVRALNAALEGGYISHLLDTAASLLSLKSLWCGLPFPKDRDMIPLSTQQSRSGLRLVLPSAHRQPVSAVLTQHRCSTLRPMSGKNHHATGYASPRWRASL